MLKKKFKSSFFFFFILLLYLFNEKEVSPPSSYSLSLFHLMVDRLHCWQLNFNFPFRFVVIERETRYRIIL